MWIEYLPARRSGPHRSRAGLRQAGFTLVEAILAIVILGVAFAGVMTVFQSSVKNSFDPVIRKQMRSVAEEMLEEIELKPFCGSSLPAATTSGCSRDGFYRVGDYNGYSTSNQICDIDGNALPALNNYSVAVSVAAGTLSGVAADQITVTVTYRTSTFTLIGWRTNYAGDAC